MTTHPVQLQIAGAPPRQRVHVLIRLALLAGIASVGWSSVYWLLYVILPAAVALVLTQKEPRRFLAEDAPRMSRVLSWLAAAYAYLWHLTDEFPTSSSKEKGVRLRIESGGNPSVSSALMRWLYSIPATLLLLVMSIPATILWIAAAVCILVERRVPEAIHRFMSLVLRYQFRLAAYHLSLVDGYPSLDELPSPSLPHPGTA
jgi:hypothetical protein